MKIAIELNRDELNQLQYAVVVEMWNENVGRVRRAFDKEFPNSADLQQARYWYNIFYDWHLRKGTPEYFIFRGPDTLIFVKRLINFFGTI